jgi:hypothetical protein
MGALPKALAHRGHRVMVVAPRYAVYDDAWETGVRAQYNVFGSNQEVCRTRHGCAAARPRTAPATLTRCAGLLPPRPPPPHTHTHARN